MGAIRFLIEPSGSVTPETAERSYFSAPDRSLWRTRARLTDDMLVVERSTTDSGYFSIPWQVPGRGELTLSTAWLMERERPYHLQVELARGKINQIRNQASDWESIGLVVPEEFRALLQQAVERFAQAATLQHEPARAAELAARAIASALDAGELLAANYASQALAARSRQSLPRPIKLAVNLGGNCPEDRLGPMLTEAFNAACVPLNWRRVEVAEHNYDWNQTDRQIAWCRAQKLSTIGGPLISFDDLQLPDWLCLWEGDFENLLSCVSEYVKTAVGRYRGAFDQWHCASRVNYGDALSLSQQDRLRIAVRVVEIIRKVDPDTPTVLTFDQPWAEYMNRVDADPPIYLADTLIRAGLDIAGVGLEINVGYLPGGSYPRDAVEINQLIDYWSLLGLPLLVLLTVPGSADAKAGADKQAVGQAQPLPDAVPGGWTAEAQRAWVERYVPLLLAKPAVQGVVWNQLGEDEPHGFPHSGLLDSQSQPKGALAALEAIRKQHLR